MAILTIFRTIGRRTSSKSVSESLTFGTMYFSTTASKNRVANHAMLKRITKYNEKEVKSEVLNILKQLKNEETVNEAN